MMYTTHDNDLSRRPNTVERIGVLVNLGARSVRLHGFDRAAIAKEVGPRGCVETFNTPGRLRRAVRRLRRARVDSVVVVGGDGTLSAVATSVAARWKGPLPRLVPLPGGSLNSTARALGTSPVPAAEAVRRLRSAAAPIERTLQSLRVDTASWRRPRLGFLFANGIVGDYVDFVGKHGGSTAWNTVRQMALLTGGALIGAGAGDAIWSDRNAEVTIGAQSRRFESFKTVVAVGAIHLPSAVTPFPCLAATPPDQFTYLLNAMPRETLLRNLLPVLRGTARDARHETGHTAHIAVQTEGHFMLDGEVYWQRPGDVLTIACGPRFVCVSFPAGSAS